MKNSKTLQLPMPLILSTTGWADYALVDCGDGQKLERFGNLYVIRPEEQALWSPSLPDKWSKADAVFDTRKNGDEEAAGHWRFDSPLSDTWLMSLDDIRFFGRFTSFRHVGFFAEQIAHWQWMKMRIKHAIEQSHGRPLRVLNLFGYTGLASLIAAGAGAEVTHVDASKKAIGWARENQNISKMDDLPIRWLCDDAMKFLARETRRGNRYDLILLDPPKYGRGPNGESWNLFADLKPALMMCEQLLSDNADSLILTAYAIRASWLAMDVLMRDIFKKRQGSIQSGELVVAQENGALALSNSLFSRWGCYG